MFRGVTQWGVAAYANDGDEEQVRARFDAQDQRRTNCERIEITGGLYGPRADDQIVLTRFNDYGVGQQIIVAFDTHLAGGGRRDRAGVLDTLAATGRTGPRRT